MALNHTEDHNFAAWNSCSIWTSTDDGNSWINQGEAVGTPKPAVATWGGLGMAMMIYSKPLDA